MLYTTDAPQADINYSQAVEWPTSMMLERGATHVADIHRLPTPLTENWEWQAEGLCRDMDSSQFFHPEGERGGPRRRRAEAAKKICQRCPVMDICRQRALETHEPYGVWGGLSEEERHAIIAAERVKRVS